MCVFVHRNYHVFYYLLAGASEEERKSFHLLKPEEYHYLNQVRTHALTHNSQCMYEAMGATSCLYSFAVYVLHASYFE